MITHQDIKNLSTEWGLSEHVIEKDFVLGWVLWGICNHSKTKDTWVFKGGTCIKKCYIETYRFSEDLDFTVTNSEILKDGELQIIVEEVLSNVAEESGIDFSVMQPKMKWSSNGLYSQCRLYYRGPLNARTPGSVILDLSASEKLATDATYRPISHPYRDKLTGENNIQCYSFEEIFAEKIRAMGERCRPRDLYDIINLFHKNDIFRNPNVIKRTLLEKCSSKQIPTITLDSIINSPYKNELISEWGNMLAHQLPALPPFDEFWSELPNLFKWLDGEFVPAELKPIESNETREDKTWHPQATIQHWGTSVPLEKIRFAGMNHLCIRLGYNNTTRLIEPYAIRRTKENKFLLCAVNIEKMESRTYRIDRIQSAEITNKVFVPRYSVEFSSIMAQAVLK